MVSVLQRVPGPVQRVLGASRHVAWYVRWQTAGSGARERGVVAHGSVLAPPAAAAQRGWHIDLEFAQALGEPGEPAGTRLSRNGGQAAPTRPHTPAGGHP
jgi:hypothetical protein